MAEKLWHGDALRAALEVSGAADPPALCDQFGVCLSALHASANSVIESELELAQEPVNGEALRTITEALGREPTEPEKALLQMRAAIGSAFSYGLFAGLALAGMEKRGASDDV